MGNLRVWFLFSVCGLFCVSLVFRWFWFVLFSESLKQQTALKVSTTRAVKYFVWTLVPRSLFSCRLNVCSYRHLLMYFCLSNCCFLVCFLYAYICYYPNLVCLMKCRSPFCSHFLANYEVRLLHFGVDFQTVSSPLWVSSSRYLVICSIAWCPLSDPTKRGIRVLSHFANLFVFCDLSVFSWHSTGFM